MQGSVEPRAPVPNEGGIVAERPEEEQDFYYKVTILDTTITIALASTAKHQSEMKLEL
jgi:hypothetical protein